MCRDSLLFMTKVSLRLSAALHHPSLSLLLFESLSKSANFTARESERERERERELVTFIISPTQSVVLNDNSRAHILKVEAFDYPCGCPRREG